MDKEYWILIITTVLAISGYLIKKLIDRKMELKKEIEIIINDFNKLQIRILSHTLLNDFNILKKEIKEFLTNNIRLLNQPEIQEFWNKWISNDPSVDHPISAVGYSSQEFKEMKDDLSKIELNKKYL